MHQKTVFTKKKKRTVNKQVQTAMQTVFGKISLLPTVIKHVWILSMYCFITAWQFCIFPIIVLNAVLWILFEHCLNIVWIPFWKILKYYHACILFRMWTFFKYCLLYCLFCKWLPERLHAGVRKGGLCSTSSRACGLARNFPALVLDDLTL